MGQLLGTAFSAPQNARIGQITDNTTDAGVVPHLARSGPVALFVQVGSNPLSAETLMYILVKDDTHHSGLGFVDDQIIKLMLALVEAPAFHKVIAVWSKAAFEAATLNELAQCGFGADRSLFAFTVSLPKADIVCELVRVAVEALLPLLGAPYLNPVLYKPFHHKGRFVRDTPNAVKHIQKIVAD